MSRLLAASVAAFLLVAPATASAKSRDYADTALNILPSGQTGGLPLAKDADRQAKMYDALTPRFDKVTATDLRKDFKSERFGTAGECPCEVENVSRKGVRIVRDKFHVPHITATTRDGLTWAAGWVTAEDRGLLTQAVRYPARDISAASAGAGSLPAQASANARMTGCARVPSPASSGWESVRRWRSTGTGTWAWPRRSSGAGARRSTSTAGRWPGASPTRACR